MSESAMLLATPNPNPDEKYNPPPLPMKSGANLVW
jgi:hypothetical protein